MIDEVSEAKRTQVSILIHDQRITAIQPGFVTPAAAAWYERVLGLERWFPAPGLEIFAVAGTGLVP